MESHELPFSFDGAGVAGCGAPIQKLTINSQAK
jgi:hypothetical protein